jgi:hypothetical protein
VPAAPHIDARSPRECYCSDGRRHALNPTHGDAAVFKALCRFAGRSRGSGLLRIEGHHQSLFWYKIRSTQTAARRRTTIFCEPHETIDHWDNLCQADFSVNRDYDGVPGHSSPPPGIAAAQHLVIDRLRIAVGACFTPSSQMRREISRRRTRPA